MIPRLAVVQFDPRPGDIAGNVTQMLTHIEAARAQGAEVVLFPEEAVSGYCVGDLNRNPLLISESLRAVTERIAPATDDLAVVTGLIAPTPGRHLNDGAAGARNEFVVAHQGRIVGRGAKALLVDDGVFYDSRYFLPARDAEIAPVELALPSGPCRLGILVCHDMWDDFSECKPARIHKEKGADLLVVLNSSPYYARRLGQRLETARRRCRETGLPLVYVNTCSVQDNGKNVILFDGGSFVLDGSGEVAAQFPQFVPGVFACPAPPPAAAPRPPSRGGLSPEPGSLKPPSGGQLASASGGADVAREAELLEALLFGLRGFFRRTGHSGAVIGLSGGIDSALSAALLVQALGPDNVLGVTLPTRFSSETTRNNARELARRLGIEFIVHSIEPAVASKRKDFRRVNGHDMQGLTFENVQARERGSVLMTYAQERGRLVIGNGNKTEFQRGYATMYGDIIGALMPLGDLAKTDVYRLARHVNERCGDPIPEAIITIPPSAELSAAQNVEEGKGDPFDYDVEGPMGQELIEQERTPDQLRRLFEEQRLDPELWHPVRSTRTVYEKLSPDEFEALAWEVFRSIERTAYKRIQAPPVLKLSRKAFGFDFRESVFASLRLL